MERKMKYILAALLAFGVLSTGIVHAKTEEVKKAQIIRKKKPSVYKKTTKPKAKPAKVQAKSHRRKAKPKKTVYKNVTKKAVSPASVKPEAAKIAQPATTPVATPKAADESAYQKLTNWLGIGAGAGATSVAAKQALVNHHRTAGYRIGPRDWHHNFPKWWANRGWTAADVDGVWYFAGYPIEWWATHYPTYYKDAVREEYAKTHTEKR